MALELALSWAWRHWKLIGWGLTALSLGIALLIARADARHWEKVAAGLTAQIERAKRESAEQLAANEKRLADATAEYAARTAAIQPIIVHSRDTVRTYAETPQGRSACLPADRVAGVQQDRDALFAGDYPAASESSTGQVPPAPAP